MVKCYYTNSVSYGASNILCWLEQQARMIYTVVIYSEKQIINFVNEDEDKKWKKWKTGKNGNYLTNDMRFAEKQYDQHGNCMSHY